MSVDTIINQILAEEGSAYTDNPVDAGGPTKYGITLATLSAYRGQSCTAQDVQNLQEDEARAIYLKRYWTDPGFSAIAKIDEALAEKMCDAGVNLGPNQVSTWLQRVLNVMSQGGSLYDEIAIDGVLGQQSFAALQAYLSHRGNNGGTVLLRAINGLQAAFYIQDAEIHVSQQQFVYGWLLNRVQ